jgi:hypothetical protein
MRKQSIVSCFAAACAAFGFLAITSTEPVFAQPANARVFGPSAKPLGSSLAEWSGKWWQWALELPVEGHPFINADDFDCGVGIADGVLYLGAVLGDTVSRTCNVPVDTNLVVGMLNVECSSLEPEPFHGDDEAAQRACATF